MSRRLLVGLTVAALAAVLAAPAAAQRISGTVRETDGGRPIAGGFISLLDGEGDAVQADFTAADGIFSFTAPGPGRYRIRVERIGYVNWVTEPYEVAAGQPLTITVEVPPDPVRLGELRVEVTGSCLDDPSEGAALATVWEEARKALETAVWAEGRGELTFTLREYRRTLDPRHLTTLETESRTRPHVRLPPFRSLPARQLTTSGYARLDADSAVFYAPDATVLLSSEFRDTQCFGLERDEVDGEPLLGITFRPRRRRDVIDIEGTLWLDEESAELRRVQIRYRNLPLPRNAQRRYIGADLTFDRLPDGPFYVRDWWVRFPIGSRNTRFRAGLSARPDPVLVAYHQVGGTVTDAFAGGVSFDVGEGAVTGVLRDSVSGEPLAGAEIVVRDWDDAAAFLPRPQAADVPFSAVTDQAGGFRVPGLPDGVYALGVDHPKLQAAGVRLNETRVVVEDRTSDPLELWTPSGDALFARICPGSSSYGSVGAVVGFVRDADTGLPVPDIEVEVVWRVRRLQGTARAAAVFEQSEYAGGVSDERGRFAICGVPLGEPAVLRVRGVDEGVELELVTRLAWRDVFVEP
ncbi:MAG: carboxypeptidase-like regulatory domain-containing protein [Gemmatimonadetes bacterium]|nr:carboxypeptidase-like regulatory domain-containing protein [Gemmatimonadota bacterium]